MRVLLLILLLLSLSDLPAQNRFERGLNLINNHSPEAQDYIRNKKISRDTLLILKALYLSNFKRKNVNVEKYYNKSLKLNPSISYAYAYKGLQDLNWARLINLDSSLFNAYKTSALKNLRKAIQLDSSSVVNYGNMLLAMSELEGADSVDYYYKQGLQKVDNKYELQLAYCGYLYMNLKDEKKLLQTLDKIDFNKRKETALMIKEASLFFSLYKKEKKGLLELKESEICDLLKDVDSSNSYGMGVYQIVRMSMGVGLVELINRCSNQ